MAQSSKSSARCEIRVNTNFCCNYAPLLLLQKSMLLLLLLQRKCAQCIHIEITFTRNYACPLRYSRVQHYRIKSRHKHANANRSLSFDTRPADEPTSRPAGHTHAHRHRHTRAHENADSSFYAPQTYCVAHDDLRPVPCRKVSRPGGRAVSQRPRSQIRFCFGRMSSGVMQ